MKIPYLNISNIFILANVTAALTSRHPNNRSNPMVIIDTDFTTIGDDGQVLAMAAQLYASKQLDILGLTIVTGNQYRDQEVADCLKAVERLGIDTDVGVYAGAQAPFLHDYTAYQLEEFMFGNATGWVGAYAQPDTHQLVAPPDGFATHTVPRKQSAVDFIIETVHRFPDQVTILAIGPLTNIALAMRQDPTIIAQIQQIVIMGGQIYVPGDAYRGVPDFNWWLDPESARVVLRANVPRKIIPLDVVDTIPVSADIFESIANHTPATAITELIKNSERWSLVYDTLALVSLFDPTFDLDVRELFVDVNCEEMSPDYGRALVWDSNPYPGVSAEKSSSVVLQVDNDRFFHLYVDLLTRPVPVVEPGPGHMKPKGMAPRAVPSW